MIARVGIYRDAIRFARVLTSIFIASVMPLAVYASGTTEACPVHWNSSNESIDIISKQWQSSNCNSSGCTQRKILKIGTALSLDYTSKYGPISRSVQQAYNLYFDWLNKHRGGVNISGDMHWVELVLLDDQSLPDRVTSITKHLAHDHKIQHFLSPYSSGLTKFAAAVVNETGGVMVASTAASTVVFKDRPRIFGTLGLSSSFVVPVIEKLAFYASKIAYVYEDLGFSRAACGAINELAAEKRMSVVFGRVVNELNPIPEGRLSGDAQQPEVDAMIHNVSKRSPDVFIACVYDNVCNRILDAAKRFNFNPKAIAITVCVAKPNFRSLMGDTGGYIGGVAPWTPEVSTTSDLTNLTVSDFNSMWNLNGHDGYPPYQAASSFSAAAALVHAIETAGSTDPDKVAESLRQMDVKGIFGRIAFDANGQGKNPIKMIQVQGDSSPVVSPAEAATAELRYPKPSFDAMACLNSEAHNIGRFGIVANGSCLACSRIEVAPYNATLGYRVCQKLMCPPGKTSVIFEAQGDMKAGAYCSDCFTGYYASDSGHTQCEACGVGTFQDSYAGKGCKLCPPGKFAPSMGAITCKPCKHGWYSANFGSSRCTKCPPGSVCTKNSLGLYTSYTSAKGFYLLREEDGSDRLIKCQHGDHGAACLEGGRCYHDPETGEATMAGEFCGKCMKGYGREKAEKICKKCPPLGETIMLSMVNLGMIIAVSGVIFALVVFSDLTKPKNIVAVILKQLLNYLTMINIVIEATDFSERFPIKVPEFLEDVVDFLKIFFGTSSPMFAAHAGECLSAQVWDAHKIYVILGLTWVPAWIIFLTFGFWLVWIFQTRRKKKPPRRSRLMTLLIVNLFVVHPRNTELCLSVFRCGHFDKPRLMMDTTLDCQSSEHYFWSLLGLSGFVFYSLGIPLAVGALLWRYKKTDSLQKKKTINTLGFLYSGFEPQHYYFEAVFMLRKVLYQLVILIPPLAASKMEDDKLIKCMSMLVLAVIFLAIHMTCEPYDNRAYFTLDRIEGAALWAVLVTLLVQTWLYISDKAFAFNEDESGDAEANKTLRDAVACIIVFFMHIRLAFLVIYLMGRPALIAITRMQIFEHGFVEVQDDGLHLVHADKLGRKLFSSMFQELTELMVDTQDGVNYDQLILSLKYMCVNCNYHRHLDRFENGHDLDDVEDRAEMHADASHRVDIYTGLSGTHARKMMKNARKHFGKKVVERLKAAQHHLEEIAQSVVEGGEHHHRHAIDAEHKVALQELEQLKKFDYKTVKACVGNRFSVEELHLSMVRLSKQITQSGNLRRGSESSTHGIGFGSAATAHPGAPVERRLQWHTAVTQSTGLNSASDGTSRTSRISFGESQDSVAAGDLVDEDIPPTMSDNHMLEKELRFVKTQLEELHTTHTEVVAHHEIEIAEHKAKEKYLAVLIKEHCQTNSGWDQESDSEASEDDNHYRGPPQKSITTGAEREEVLPSESQEAQGGDAATKAKTAINRLSTSNITCENCGNALLVDARYCSQCGHALCMQTPRSMPERTATSSSPTSCDSRSDPGMAPSPEYKAKPEKQSVQEAAEDQMYILRFELDAATLTNQTQAAALREERAKVAELEGQLLQMSRERPRLGNDRNQVAL